MAVLRHAHTGVVVRDLAAAAGFFTLLGLECGDPMAVEGEWLDSIIAVPGARVEIVMVRTPDGDDALELVTFHEPADGAGAATTLPAPVNRPGIRHVAFAVDDMRATVDRLRAAGWDTVGDVVDYRGVFLLCYVRGPEGIIVELAERLPVSS
jgi:catechol 2,3-dioxygenase-like lactoylglutathione lyase family enzyme